MMRLLLAFVLCLTACGSLGDHVGRPDVRAIGPAGGKVCSQDGRFCLEVPKGAISSEVTLSVTQKTAYNPHMAGSLYAVAPLGLELAAKAHLTLTPVGTPDYMTPPALGKVNPDRSWDPIPGSLFQNGTIDDKDIQTLEVFAAWVSCNGDAACGGGAVCLIGETVNPRYEFTCGTGCSGAEDCKKGDVCDGGHCLTPCVDTCASTTDCDARATCETGADGCKACVSQDCVDLDGDGYGVGKDCLGPDCNDNDPNVHPGAKEICDFQDNDCNLLIDECPGGTYCMNGKCP